MYKPDVSCIIPVYNGEEFISEAIKSALHQSHPLLEIIVVDDGSTDATSRLVEAFKEARIRYVVQSNAGCTDARNHGLRLAKGEFVSMLDADDIWEFEKTARQLERFSERPEVEACTTLMQNFWAAELQEEARSNPHLAVPQPGVASTFMCRKEVVDRVGYLDPRYPDRDLQEWLLRLRESGGQYAVLEQVLVRRRVHANNMSRGRAPGESQLLDLASRLLERKRSK